MSTQSILRELEQLRKTLDRCPCVSTPQRAAVSPKSSCGCQCSCSSTSASRRHHDAPPVDRLATSAARLDAILQQSNDRLDADTRTVADTYKRSHQHKESELARLHTALRAKDKVIDNLRETLRTTKTDMQDKLSDREASLAQALASLSSTQQQLASARGETEALSGSLNRTTSRLHDTEAELLQALQGKQAAQVQWRRETHHRHVHQPQASAVKDLEAARSECKRVTSALEVSEARVTQLAKEVAEGTAAAVAHRQELRAHVAQATQDLEQCLDSLKQQVCCAAWSGDALWISVVC